MSETRIVGGKSQEEVAYQLFERIAEAEGKKLAFTAPGDADHPGRKWILQTYAECLRTVQNPLGY